MLKESTESYDDGDVRLPKLRVDQYGNLETAVQPEVKRGSTMSAGILQHALQCLGLIHRVYSPI